MFRLMAYGGNGSGCGGAMELYLVIDGGGTKCRARIADGNGVTLGEGIAGSANTRLGLDAVFAEIASAAGNALAAAGLPDAGLGDLHAGLGLAGLALESERAKVAAYAHPFATMVAESDAHTACLGAHSGRDGAILIVGTGCCGCALEGGVERTISGWGFEIGDRGSGAWIGHRACRRALWAFEGLAPYTDLAREIMARFDDSPEIIVGWATAAKPRDFGSVVPLVFAHAERGDALALTIVRQAARDISALVAKLIGSSGLKLALVGGVAEPITPYLDEEVRARLMPPEGGALSGALRLSGCPGLLA